MAEKYKNNRYRNNYKNDGGDFKNDFRGDRKRDFVPEESENIVAGRNSVRELLKSGKAIDKLYILKGAKDGSLSPIFAEALSKGVAVIESDRSALDRLAANNQGVVAQIPDREYASLDDILNSAKEKGEPPFVVICDGVCDPQNLGAIIRTAECAGCHGVVVPKRRSALLTSTVVKASAGAAERLPVCKVPNLNAAIDYLKQNNVWVYALEADGVPYDGQDFSGGTAFVLGGEGDGVSRLVKENSDCTVSIPMYGTLNSLNVSATAAIILFEAAKHRHGRA